MISVLSFTLSATCLVAMFMPTRPRQTLETYYVCGPESHPVPETEVAPLALAGGPRG